MSAKRREEAEVAEVFRLLNITTVERDPSYLRQLTNEFAPNVQNSGVEYRTVLTNGTGRLPELVHAQLE